MDTKGSQGRRDAVQREVSNFSQDSWKHQRPGPKSSPGMFISLFPDLLPPSPLYVQVILLLALSSPLIPRIALMVLSICHCPQVCFLPAFLLRPEMSCLLVISLGAQRLDKGKTKFSSFLHPVSTSSFGILQVDRSHCHPKKQSVNHSWYLLFSDQSYSGL